jgi:anti-sigma B factor antagonist
MEIVVSDVGGVAVVALKGDVDLQHSPTLRKGLMGCLFDKKDVVVDMAAVSYIDSSGIASLVEGYQMARKNGTRFGLAAVSPAAIRVLQLARLDKVFSIHPTLDDALKA